MDNSWTKSERCIALVAYGITAAAVSVFAISQFIEACRSRPKVKMIVLGMSDKAKDQAKVESSSAADNQ